MSSNARSAQSAILSVSRDFSKSSSAASTSTVAVSSSQSRPGRPPQQPLTEAQKAARKAARNAGIQKALSTSDLPPPPVAGVKRESETDIKQEQPPAKRGSLVDTVNTPHAALSPMVAGGDFAQPSTSKPAVISIAAKIVLSAEQQEILKLVTAGKNIFFTGSAGTGKSVLLRELLRALRKKYVRSADAVAVTASTGMAACNIGGVTLHSFAGIGLGEGTAEQLAQKVKKNKKSASRWLRTQVLIIDEISMVDGVLFDKLARVACLVRSSTKPFGGIQLIVCGDFFQLPPVAKNNDAKFAFEAELWTTCVERTFNLTKVFRQKDQQFVDMLNEMRFGTMSPQSIRGFARLARPIDTKDGIEPAELYPRREDVDRSNEIRNRNLTGSAHVYNAIDSGTVDPDQRAKLLSQMMAPARLSLKIDTQVMLIKNVDESLVNGSLGRVVAFRDEKTHLQMENGMTTNDIEAAEEEERKKKGKKAVANGGAAGMVQYPLVRFAIPGGQTRDVLVLSESWKVELPSGEVQASRSQLPLILAWAMSIHKSQGQTLPKVKVDLTKIFEKGQAYVALSRATSMEGLQVLGFHKDKVMAHPRVVQWSKTLETIN